MARGQVQVTALREFPVATDGGGVRRVMIGDTVPVPQRRADRLVASGAARLATATAQKAQADPAEAAKDPSSNAVDAATAPKE